MASTGQVGVVVPVWKRARTVLRSLASVANQTLAANRVIVVDDGSVDGTAASVMEWLARRQPGDGWQLIRQPHRGVASARNRGFAELCGC